MKKSVAVIIVCFFGFFNVSALDIIWTGNANDLNFFNESNWIYKTDNTIPPPGSIDPNTVIDGNLQIANLNLQPGVILNVMGSIKIGVGSLSIKNSTLKLSEGSSIDMGLKTNALLIDSSTVSCSAFYNATLTLTGNASLYLTSSNPLDVNSTINITSYDAWIFMPAINAETVNTSKTSNFKIFGSAFQTNINASILQYYDGAAINPLLLNYKPLQIYENDNFTGSVAEIETKTIFSATSIPNNLNNKTSSFRLKKGYMVVFANEVDGTGISQVYIASESDLHINTLPNGLKNNISFIRVLPWSWVNKKGTGGDTKGVNASWYYNWGTAQTSNLDRQYAPMTWGRSSIDTQDKVNALVRKNYVTHVMSFNESDNCEDQSGQYGMLCNVDTAVKYHKNLMKTGLRILSPSCREGEELKWVKNLNTLAVPQGIRMDAIGMHWYDWGANPTNTPDEDPAKIFARFKAKVIACYNYYKMPIWITEFNANKFRNTWVQDEFLKLALPWLESTWYVERYAYFQPFGGKGNFFDANGIITSTGSIYLNQVSTPSIREQDYNKAGNNLQDVINTVTDVKEVIYKKKKFEAYPNPAKNELLVVSNENINFDLTDIRGSKLQSFPSNEKVALNGILKGIYIVSAIGYVPQKLFIN